MSDGGVDPTMTAWVRWADDFLALLGQEHDALRQGDGERLAFVIASKRQALAQRPGGAPHGGRIVAQRLAACRDLNLANGTLLHIRAQRIRERLGGDQSAAPAYNGRGHLRYQSALACVHVSA